MPDIKTALESALKEWEPPAEGTVIEAAAPASAPKTPRNMTRDCFTMVRDNPGITRTNAVQRLEAMGHKPTSTTSILSQMVKTKMITEVGHGILSTKRKNYTPLQTKVRKVDKAKPQPKAVVAKAPAPSVAAPQPEPTHTLAPTLQRVSEGHVDAWMDTIPLKVAREIYLRLDAIFGAQK